MSKSWLVAVPIFATMLLAGCAGRADEQDAAIAVSVATATATLVPATTPGPTATPPPLPTATRTPGPTATPVPTVTPTPTPIPKAELPSPTWVFAGNIPTEHQTVLRDEMEASRAYFLHQYGVEATGFTVVVGEDYEAMAPVYREVTGLDLLHAARPDQKDRAHGWVTSTPTGGSVIGLMYGHVDEWTLSGVRGIIAHEYFHILQGQMASGFVRTGSGEVAWGFRGNRGPTWLVEGLAVYADYVYTPTRPGRRSLLMRATPYKDLAWQRARDSEALVDDLAIELARIEDREAFHGCSVGWHSYALSFIAATFLVEEVAKEENAYVTYWRLLGERPTWQLAFEQAFGLSIADFYTAFNKWINSRVSPVPPMVQFEAQLRWPGQSTESEGLPRFKLEEDHGSWVGTPIDLVLRGSGGFENIGEFYVIYPRGATGSGILSLWWTEDGCTEYLLGYYKDGSLTARREDATLVEFTGMSANIDWIIPADPSTLPHLGCSGCDCAVSRSDAGGS